LQSILMKKLKFNNQVQSAGMPVREKIDDKYKWDLTHIYSSDDEWEKEFRWVEKNISGYRKFSGNLSDSSESLLACLKFDESIGTKLERLYLYAMLAKDSDMSVNKYQAMDDRIKSLASSISAVSSFIKPEILQIPDNKINEFISSNDELKIYKHSLENIVRTKAHSLSKQEEQILALAGEITQTPYNTYSMFTNADLKFPVIQDSSGEEVQISHARFYSAMYSKDESYRKRVFEGYLKPYDEYSNTIATLLNGNLKSNIFYAKARKYNSAREAALDQNNIPLNVYDNLIETVNKNLKPLHRWAALKKKLLNIEQLKPYDVYVTVFNETKEKSYTYESSKKIVLDSLSILGDDYLNSLNLAFDNRWIDVYETKAKKSGAYSSGTTFGVHPYVLLNWTDLLNDLFTLSHEMGHNMHSYYTGKNQPYTYANYSIFVAEVASTFNESLLLDYLITNASDDNERLYFLEKYLNNITATFYRQVMFAEFEIDIYQRTENGEALTPNILSELYKDIYQKYWGPDMDVADEEKYTWARIPHFYYNFYVYQYATGFAASEILAAKVKSEGKNAVKKYLDFLKAGSSDYPINILKSAGVDMSSPEPILAVSARMDKILNEINSLLKNK